MSYSLEDFQKILETIDLDQLPIHTIEIINELASQVGAPEYIKTPQFKAKPLLNAGTGTRRKKKFQENINDDDWGAIRTFQTTEFQKKEGLELSLYKIRKSLNMLTEKTYIKFCAAIIDEFETVCSTKTLNDVMVLGEQIYVIVSSNILYSDIYAKLYKDLIAKFPIFNELLLKNLNILEARVQSVEYIDPEDDYNKFCENNKKNELLRATGAFYAHLMKEGILTEEQLHGIIMVLFGILDIFIEENKKNELDELSELIYIIVINSYEKIKNLSADHASEIYKTVQCIANTKMKTTPGITNKCIFKHMDMIDEIG